VFVIIAAIWDQIVPLRSPRHSRGILDYLVMNSIYPCAGGGEGGKL